MCSLILNIYMLINLNILTHYSFHELTYAHKIRSHEKSSYIILLIINKLKSVVGGAIGFSKNPYPSICLSMTSMIYAGC